MKVFYTRSTPHLASQLPYQQGKYLCKSFSDGELYIKLEEDVTGESVWVIANTLPPAEHLMELLLLLDALQRSGAIINLIFTYFAYARQDKPLAQEAASMELICHLLKTFAIQKIAIIHAHSMLLHNYIDFENVIPLEQIAQIAQKYDALAAPDKSARALVEKLSQQLGMEAIFLTKSRLEQGSVEILSCDGNVHGKKILLIDDMIATSNTVIETSKMLKILGATHISVWATHGIFSGNAHHELEKSGVTKIYVTNTIAQKNGSSKIEVISIAPLLEQIVQQYR